MSIRYPGGLITKNPVVPSTSSAAGIWTLEQALEYIKAGTWPVTSDPYFEYVTMLLHGNGTNGAQNNTFLDSSTNAFTITRNGNATQGSFSPFSRTDGNWSNYFDGTGDNLSTTLATALQLSGDFTVEVWINLSSAQTNYRMIASDNNGLASTYISVNSTGLEVQFGGGAGTISSITQTFTVGTWYHVAVVRVGSTVSIYVDGQSKTVSQATQSGTLFLNGGTFYIGRWGNPANEFLGYISNFRIVKGTAVYTGNFTPPTTPLTAITNTSLLTCQSNRFKDNSTNNFTITRNGDTSVQVFNPFNPTTAYSTTTNGGSGYFDGSGDYLDAPANTAFDLGSGNFTIEMWVYTNRTADSWVTGYYVSNPQTTPSLAYVVFINGGNWQLYLVSGSTENVYTIGTTGAISNNAWHHIACTRDGNNLRIFLDGALISTNTYTLTLNNPAGAVYRVGGFSGTFEDPYAGYISGLRVLKGTALYTAAFTPPTSPPTNITNTSLLLNFTNGGIFDNAAMNNLETVGNAQISTAQSKFGGGSMYFDGTGDRLQGRATPEVTFGTGDFTVEGWLYLNSVSALQMIFDQRPASTNGAYPLLYMNGAAMTWYVSSADRIASSSLSTGTWYHFAVSRSGTSTKMFINGTQAGSTYTDSTNYLASNLYIGASAFDGGGVLNGYIDDFRITKGYARYTANFTPPTAPFADK